MANAINWFEIPSSNYERALDFYGKVFNTELYQQDIMGIKMAFLPCGEGEVGGAICYGDGNKPSENGARVYLNGGEDLSIPLSKIEAAGGKVVLPKTKISDEIGYMATFLDTEGNQISFHSPN
ncbi:MAG: VOC family protein [Flammeovirgaceae bacterium]|nr:VOC family protein [Flammeovirgaceae bacterium]